MEGNRELSEPQLVEVEDARTVAGSFQQTMKEIGFLKGEKGVPW